MVYHDQDTHEDLVNSLSELLVVSLLVYLSYGCTGLVWYWLMQLLFV